MSKDLQGRGGWMGCWGRTTQVHTGMQSEAQCSWDIHEVGRRPLRLEQREGGKEGGPWLPRGLWLVLCRIQGGKKMCDVHGGNILVSDYRTDCTGCRQKQSS